MEKRLIYKYPLTILSDRMVIEMPEGAKILSVQVQGAYPTIWAVVDPTAPTTKYTLAIVGTGWETNASFFDEFEFLDTVQVLSLVWHIFLKKP